MLVMNPIDFLSLPVLGNALFCNRRRKVCSSCVAKAQAEESNSVCSHSRLVISFIISSDHRHHHHDVDHSLV